MKSNNSSALEDPSPTLNNSSLPPQPQSSYNKPSTLKQTFVLLLKNFKVVFGKPSFIASHILTTLTVYLVIVLLNYLTRNSYENEPPLIFPINNVDNIQRCNWAKCKSLGYVLIVTLF